MAPRLCKWFNSVADAVTRFRGEWQTTRWYLQPLRKRYKMTETVLRPCGTGNYQGFHRLSRCKTTVCRWRWSCKTQPGASIPTPDVPRSTDKTFSIRFWRQNPEMYTVDIRSRRHCRGHVLRMFLKNRNPDDAAVRGNSPKSFARLQESNYPECGLRSSPLGQPVRIARVGRPLSQSRTRVCACAVGTRRASR
jgi:hypothetical protein